MLNVDVARLLAGITASAGRTEERLNRARQRERQFRELLDALPAAIYTTDAAGRITFYNKAAADLWGCSPELGSEWCGSWRLYEPDGTPLPHDRCPMAIALKEDRPVRGVEAIAERPDGTHVPFIPYPTPLRDAAGRLVGAVNMLVDISDRKAAETALREAAERLDLVAREVDHRANNMLATVLAITRMTRAETVPQFVKILTGRLLALSRAHNLLAESRWAGADLRRLVEEEVAAFAAGEAGRVTVSGPALALPPAAAQALAMALHELATNAAKYGALSARAGHVQVEWSFGQGKGLVLCWTETGGPSVQAPTRRGFGTGLIEATIEKQLRGKACFAWPAEGLTCEIAIPHGSVA